ncbi:MAG: Rpn family recombination-promoting nuclease/putative transposase [Treponema sp.]|nr:Rpn family recombination-promoting nuclease/putative transposase [Treponema sp.]
MLSEAELQKKWESLTFTDDFIFSRVMRDENRIITVEMQTGHTKELPRRSRYYQSVADVSTTPTGAKYRKLPDNILIFICTFDPFDRNFSRYTFEYTCKESNHQLKLEDGTIRIFLNTKATELSDLDQKLQAFYHYLQKGVVESDLTQDISNKITTLKNNSIERRTFMTLALKLADARYDGFEEGREEGAYQTKLEMARKFLSMGLTPEQVVQGTSLPLEQVQKMAQEK